MQTTLQIDDEVLEAARSRAESLGSTVDRVITDLAREALALRLQAAPKTAFPVFEVDPDSAPITPEMVKRALEE
jgi:hypothetical protein